MVLLYKYSRLSTIHECWPHIQDHKLSVDLDWNRFGFHWYAKNEQFELYSTVDTDGLDHRDVLDWVGSYGGCIVGNICMCSIVGTTNSGQAPMDHLSNGVFAIGPNGCSIAGRHGDLFDMETSVSLGSM